MSKGLRVTNGRATVRVVIDDAMLRDLWCSATPLMDVCWTLGAFQTEVVKRARELGLPPRPRGRTPGHSTEEETPSEEEIIARCAVIRETRWTEEEYARRASAGCRWQVPTAKVR